MSVTGAPEMMREPSGRHDTIVLAFALPQSEKLGIGNVVGTRKPAGAESDRAAYPRSGL
jgi:hypothetical protein